MSNADATVKAVKVEGGEVSVETSRGMTFIFATAKKGAPKLVAVVVDYAWIEAWLPAEERAKHVHRYEPKACPVVLTGLVMAREAARKATATAA